MTKEQIYDERIAPLMAQIIRVYKESNIAFVASYQLSGDEDENGPLFCTSCLLLEGCDPRLDEAKEVICGQKLTTLSMIVKSVKK